MVSGQPTVRARAEGAFWARVLVACGLLGPNRRPQQVGPGKWSTSRGVRQVVHVPQAAYEAHPGQLTADGAAAAGLGPTGRRHGLRPAYQLWQAVPCA